MACRSSLRTSNPYGLLGTALSNLSGAQIGASCGAAFVPTITGTITTSVTNNVSNNPAILPPGTANGITTTNNATNCTAPNNAQGILNALEQVGLVHMLAEPNLTAVSGETAKFLAGGEFPVPAGRDQQGNISIEFKQFGVGLSFTPVVISPGRISLQLSTEVSELTNTGAFTLQGANGLGHRRHHPRPVGAPRRDHGGIALGRQLRHRRPDAAQHQAGD